MYVYNALMKIGQKPLNFNTDLGAAGQVIIEETFKQLSPKK